MDNRVALAVRRLYRRRRRTVRVRGARHPIRSTAVFTLVLSAVMAATFIGLLEFRLRPVVEQLAARQVNNHVTARLNGVLSPLVTVNGALVEMQRGADGEILGLSMDTQQLNQIRGQVVQAALDTLAQVDVHTLGVPLGSLFDFDLLWAKGPVVEVHSLVAGTVTTVVRTEFQSAGINQTLHRVLLDVEVPLAVLLPGSRGYTVAQLTLCMAETVVVGKVPQTYLNLSDTLGGEEDGGKTGDFAAAAGAGAGGL